MIGKGSRAAGGIALITLALALGACEGRDSTAKKLDTLDKELVGGNDAAGTDPALTAALEDQIMVDPALAGQANGTRRPTPGAITMPVPPERKQAQTDASYAMANGKLLRTPEPGKFAGPAGGSRPVTLGQLAEQQKGKGAAGAGCAKSIDYSARWAARMPAQFPVYPNANVVEAAGANEPGCAMRIVTFRTDANMQGVLDYYYTQALKAGFSAEHQADGSEHVLGGTRGDSALMIFARPQNGGGTEVDLVVRIS